MEEVKQDVLGQFFKGTELSNNFSKSEAILTEKSEDKPTDTYRRIFQRITMFLSKKLWPLGLFSGDKGDWIDV